MADLADEIAQLCADADTKLSAHRERRRKDEAERRRRAVVGTGGRKIMWSSNVESRAIEIAEVRP